MGPRTASGAGSGVAAAAGPAPSVASSSVGNPIGMGQRTFGAPRSPLSLSRQQPSAPTISHASSGSGGWVPAYNPELDSSDEGSNDEGSARLSAGRAGGRRVFNPLRDDRERGEIGMGHPSATDVFHRTARSPSPQRIGMPLIGNTVGTMVASTSASASASTSGSTPRLRHFDSGTSTGSVPARAGSPGHGSLGTRRPNNNVTAFAFRPTAFYPTHPTRPTHARSVSGSSNDLPTSSTSTSTAAVGSTASTGQRARLPLGARATPPTAFTAAATSPPTTPASASSSTAVGPLGRSVSFAHSTAHSTAGSSIRSSAFSSSISRHESVSPPAPTVQQTHIALAPPQTSAATSSAIHARSQPQRNTLPHPLTLNLGPDLGSSSADAGSPSTLVSSHSPSSAGDMTPVEMRLRRSLRDSVLSTSTTSTYLTTAFDRRSFASFATGATIGTLDSPITGTGSGANTTETLSGAFALGRPRRVRPRRDAADEGMFLAGASTLEDAPAVVGANATGRLWGVPRVNHGDYIVSI
ncbi:hypothetical protein BKA62DRAFT_37505 [Auriculariales sp. MPI-PUGE-AT-0066]|nr:hypothetical protein BKA62DRAFT_37505 [Auriculariales sp. MPI-PUGE-AT-0066]